MTSFTCEMRPAKYLHELGSSIESGLGIAYNTHVNTCRPPSSPPLHQILSSSNAK